MSMENNRKRRHNSNNSASGGASTPLSKKLNSGTGSVISDVKPTPVTSAGMASTADGELEYLYEGILKVLPSLFTNFSWMVESATNLRW